MMDEKETNRLAAEIQQRAPEDAIALLDPLPDPEIAGLLTRLHPSSALNILERLDPIRRQKIVSAAPSESREQWTRNQSYPEGNVGRLMEPVSAVFGPDVTVREATDRLRDLARQTLFTYGYVIDGEERLIGVLVMRDLMLADPAQRLHELMIRHPFSLRPDTDMAEALPLVLVRHYPVYPVCDASGRLIGIVRGYVLFEEQTIEISAQPGRMVGVEEEDRPATPWARSLRFRHPWLQFNLLTAFLAAAVVGLFEQTIQQAVALAVFLPVLAGQSGNTGCQSLAVTLRGMTLGELENEKKIGIILKEIWLGFLNGGLVGLTAGLGMFVYATVQHHDAPLRLALVVFLAMVASCITSGLAGAMIPIGLKRLGADPATASSIFLTTATDIVSMGVFLGLATLLVL